MKIEMDDCVYRFVPVMGYGLMLTIETFKAVLSLYMRCLSSSSLPIRELPTHRVSLSTVCKR